VEDGEVKPYKFYLSLNLDFLVQGGKPGTVYCFLFTVNALLLASLFAPTFGTHFLKREK
jgi:hypothetical protein